MQGPWSVDGGRATATPRSSDRDAPATARDDGEVGDGTEYVVNSGDQVLHEDFRKIDVEVDPQIGEPCM